ncbi:hypothetical protein HY604_03165, partial [Candidatus Peregrinibacteria bacterium]|nr:hypothetical protein [Candidatus Peregrinibacteria bacterium]
QFVKLGISRNRLTRELLMLLPEIFKSGIYREYSATIVEYAGRFGGLSKGVVLKRLRLEKRLEDKPILREAILTEGVHKVALLAGVVTKENEQALVDKLRGMSKPGVEQMAKEIRAKRAAMGGCGEDARQMSFVGGVVGGDGAANGEIAKCKAVPVKIKFELDEKMTLKFLQLKRKMGKNLQNQEVMEKILEVAMAGVGCNHSENKGRETRQSRVSVPGDTFQNKKSQKKAEKTVSRTVSAARKREALSETGGKCAYPNCNLPADVLHHPERFAISRSHKSLRPLCKSHHEFMHNELVANENGPVEEWEFVLSGGALSSGVPNGSVLDCSARCSENGFIQSAKVRKIDELYKKYRRK